MQTASASRLGIIYFDRFPGTAAAALRMTSRTTSGRDDMVA